VCASDGHTMSRQLWPTRRSRRPRERNNVEPSEVDPCLSGNVVPTLNNNIPGAGVPMICKEIQECVESMIGAVRHTAPIKIRYVQFTFSLSLLLLISQETSAYHVPSRFKVSSSKNSSQLQVCITSVLCPCMRIFLSELTSWCEQGIILL